MFLPIEVPLKCQLAEVPPEKDRVTAMQICIMTRQHWVVTPSSAVIQFYCSIYRERKKNEMK